MALVPFVEEDDATGVVEEKLRAILATGALDRKTKEMIPVAVSATGNP